MTDKEQALKDMQERCRICKRDALPTEKECENCYFPIAIGSIEKQIPKKAKHLRNERVVFWDIAICECPICEEEIHFVDHNEIKYCTHCGQALKCENEKEERED